MTIGTRIRELRIKKEINQTNLAKIAGSSSQMISMIESDKSKPTLELLTELSKIFGVTTDYLLTGSEGITEISADEKEVIEIMRGNDDFKKAVKQAASFQKKAVSYLGNYAAANKNAVMG
jgi:transcriptional regulator with XRE-family HTH domain